MPLGRSRMAAALCAAGLAGTAVFPAIEAQASPTGCAPVTVPGAERQTTACLPDLTMHALAGTQYTSQADWAPLTAAGTHNPAGVPGAQIDGYFPDTSHLNTLHGWNHDAQFVIRLPRHWNGGLVVTGAPGNRTQYATDFAISDRAIAQGYAYASTDKGNYGVNFYSDGKKAGDAIAEWNSRVTQLTRAAKAVVRERYGHAPRRTYMTGLSNGGYLTLWQLENHPELYDGGVAWEPTVYQKGGVNLLHYLPTAVAYTRGKADRQQMIKAGFAPNSEFLWPYHAKVYWGLTQKIYRAEFDPSYDPGCPGPALGGTLDQILAPCPSDAEYHFASRPRSVRRAVDRIALTGKIGKPLLLLDGTLDSLLPITTNSDVYARMVRTAGRGSMLRYYRIQDGNHIDSLFDKFPAQLRPMLPCYRTASDALVAWVEHHRTPPRSTTVARPGTGDLLNTCALS